MSAEFLIFTPQIRSACIRWKRFHAASSSLSLNGITGGVINNARSKVEPGSLLHPASHLRLERLRADNQGTPGKRGQWLIRRIPISSRPQGKCLPPSLAGIMKPVDPRKASGPRSPMP